MGFDVEAADGHIGKIDDTRPTAGSVARRRDGSRHKLAGMFVP
jgi:hypothetical protein